MITSIDIQAKNIMIGAKTESIFKEWDQDEEAELISRKFDGDRVV